MQTCLATRDNKAVVATERDCDDFPSQPFMTTQPCASLSSWGYDSPFETCGWVKLPGVVTFYKLMKRGPKPIQDKFSAVLNRKYRWELRQKEAGLCKCGKVRDREDRMLCFVCREAKKTKWKAKRGPEWVDGRTLKRGSKYSS